MKVRLFVFCLLAVWIIACNERQLKKDPAGQKALSEKSGLGEGASIVHLDERLLGADSLVFVFYDDPQGPDSLRYTRYYKLYSSTDSALTGFLLQNLADSTQRLEKIKNCRSEGKIWCFAKGKVFQTIYFSAFSRECSFVYIIKDGIFYYSNISEALVQKLAVLKKKAIKP